MGNDNSKMISVKIYIEVEPKIPVDKIFEKYLIRNADENIRVELITKDASLAFDGNVVLQYLVSFGIGVASGVVGNCIYNAIHNAAKKLEINDVVQD